MRTTIYTRLIILSVLFSVVSKTSVIAQKERKESKEEDYSDSATLHIPFSRISTLPVSATIAPNTLKSISGNTKYKTSYLNSECDYFWSEDKYMKSGICDKEGNVILPDMFRISSNYKLVNINYVITSLNKTFGVFDLKKKKWTIPMIYDEITPVFNTTLPTEAFIVSQKGKKGMMSAEGEMLIPFEWESIYSSEQLESYAIVETQLPNLSRNKTKGIYDISKKRVTVPCEYTYIQPIGSNLLKVNKRTDADYYESVIDIENKPVFEKRYENLIPKGYNDSIFFIAKLNNKYGFIDINEKILIPFQYKLLNFQPFYPIHPIIFMNEEDKYGVINRNGEVLMPFEYEHFRHIENDVYLLSKEGKTGFCRINLETKTECPPLEFDDAILVNHLFIVKKRDKYGLVNWSGTPITEIEYSNFNILSDNQNIVLQKKDSCTLFNKNGYRIFKNNYSELTEIPSINNRGNNNYYETLKYNFLKAKSQKKYSIVDMMGRDISTPIFDDILSETKELFIVKSKNKCGIYSGTTKKMIVNYNYDTILFTEDKFIGIKGNDIEQILITTGSRSTEVMQPK